MASIDQLQIDIVAQDKASATLNDLTRSIESLGAALDKLDPSKMTSFAKAVDKLASVGANTNVTAKGIKSFANEIGQAFGISTKKGIDDLRLSLQYLYEVHKQASQGIDVGNMYDNAQKGVQKAIESNYKYKQAVDSTTKSVKEYVDATNKSGTKVGMADMMTEFGENFKEMSSVLGGAFKNNLSSAQEGVMDLAEYLSEMNSQLGTNFDTENVEKGFADLVQTVKNAKDVVLDFKEASKQGLISDDDTYGAVIDVTDKIAALYKEQEKFNASNGLGGIVSVLSQLSNMQVPDLSQFISATQEVSRNAPQMQTVSQGVSNIGQAATEATSKVESLNEALTQSKTIIEGNEEKEYGFTMKEAPQPQNVQYPPMVVEQAQAFEEKLLPAIIDTENEISNLYQRMMNVSSVEAAYDAITEKFIEWKTQLMEMNGAISGDKWIVPEFKGNADFSRQQTGWISNIKPEVVEGYFYEIEDAANKCLPAIVNVGTTALATADQFRTIENQAKEAYEATGANAVSNSMEETAQEANKAASAIEEAIKAIRNYKQTINEMESGKIPFDSNVYDNAIKGLDKASSAVKEYKDNLLGVNKDTESAFNINDKLTNIVELGDALEKVSEKFNMVAEKGISMFKFLTTPLRKASEEYIEKFHSMGEHVQNFQKNFKAHMAKISAFWKRTMRTFTFMLVRKAFTAIIKEANRAIQSMAIFSDKVGTEFNKSMSLLVADFQYLGRSIVSVFAPLINIIAPIIDAIVDRIATLLSYIGMLFAALGGKGTFTKAKKDVNNYAAGLDKASKSAKNLTMGIDELNILADNKSGSGGYDGNPMAEWEEVEIPDWILDLSDKFKKFWDDFTAPLKKAWDLVKEYFMFAFKYMTDEVGKLAKSIYDAFMHVWNEEETVRLFATILRIVADLMIVIGNLAKRFREAWDEAERGIRIFELMRDILLILAEHVRNVTWYMVRWSSEITFAPLLDGVIALLDAFKELADFLGGVFEDVMKNVVLRYIKFLIEEGFPHLMNTIAEVIKAFDFEKIRQDLRPLEDAFARLLENLDIGQTEAIGNLGKQIANFANSQEFTDFMQRLADIMDLISAEDVEKILTGIGQGILEIANAVVKFVNSDAFMGFLEMLDKWLENASSEDIANILKNLAIAIGMFKFGAFATEGLAGFFKFATVLTALKNLHEIAAGFSSVGAGAAEAGAGATAASGGFAAVAGTVGTVAAVIAIVVGAVYSLTSSFGGLIGLIDRLKESADRVADTFKAVAKAIKLDEHIEKLKSKFQELLDKLANMSDFWNLVIGRFEFLGHLIMVVLVPAIDVLVTAFTVVIDIISGVIDVLGGLATAISGVVEGITTGDWSKVQEGFSRIGDGMYESLLLPFGDLAEGLNGAITGGIEGIGNLIYGKTGEEIKTADWEKIPEDAQVGKKLANGVTTSYKTATSGAELTMKETTKSFLTNGLSSVEDVDYETFGGTYNQKILENLAGGADVADWATYGTIVNEKVGQEVINQNQPFEDANLATATEGAATFGNAYAEYFGSNTEIATSLGEFGRTSGLELANGFNESIESNTSATQSALTGWFMRMQAVVSEQMSQVRTLFSKLITSMFSEADVNTPIATMFVNVTTAVTTNINTLGSTLQSTILPMFMETYILPFFNTDVWQPLFDNLMNMVFIPFFETFSIWFTEEAMTPWWEEQFLTWFEAEKWNEEIFDPLQENIQEHWDTFSTWWDTTMSEWWENQVKPWFKKELWEEQFNNILEVAKKVFTLIQEAIKERIDKAKEAVVAACDEMKSALNEVLSLINEILDKVGEATSKGIPIDVLFKANGGFVGTGDLFIANEAGPELVGTIGGKTAVASNQEITGIADAVYATGNAETQLLAQLISIGRQMLDKDPVVISDKDIARMAVSGQDKLGMSIIS